MASHNSLPAFDELPLRSGDPKFAAWGLWGDDDELGTLNLLTPDVVKLASQEIRTGQRITLNLPLDAFVRPMNPVRKPCDHRIIAKGHANDDELNINTQGASHWDGLRHFPYQTTLQYYNGVTQDDISGPSANSKIGIQNVAEHAIVGRGVLLDWASYATEKRIAYSPFDRFGIPLDQLLEVAALQKVEFRPGDILFIRTGWLESYRGLSIEQRRALPDRAIRSSCGVEASLEAIRWHWDNRFAAVASDTVAYEAWPSPKPAGVAMHEVFLSGWGMPIGECFDLEGLAETCKKERRWTFFLSSVPLNVPGGVASPPNAVAIL
ncbi:uncharacterized protein B0I36DRAFT_316058 [Microdochium trichocladiopsis]|uniref:Cyclase n=1 Tax=Microdochium trichocladiopsis TaxID=1682393 RepID=A0A9P8YI43_9PEZI|nr:uncharacterized protein B0I36DRAFT_316058 [Microdochium trichocladiopsis]KAH7038364.1 hypothetical protein B0I36DRAFT_316058 [Microdochium trichocladiopsis]